MEAIILVGGQGTRLRPLTVHTPKPLLPVAGVPVLTHQLAQARTAGVDHVVLATCYRPETLMTHFGDGSALGIDLEYVTENQPLGTGGGIRNAADRLRCGPDDPVFVFNGDTLSGHDLTAQLALHRREDADVTLYLTEVADARAFGCVPTDGRGRVTAFREKMPEPVTNRINAGCYLFRRRAIDTIPPGQVVSVERVTFPGLLETGATLMGYVDTAYWLDLGTPAAFVRGSCDLVLGRVASPALPVRTGEALLLGGASVAEDAKLSGGTTVGAGAVVEPGARVHAAVLLDGAVVKTGARVVGSVVGRGAVVGADTLVEDSVVGDGAHVGARNELRAGARVWCEAVIADGTLRFSSDC